MKSSTLLLRSLVTLVCLLGGAGQLVAQGNAFTYQGQLNDNGAPASGSYDLRFALYPAASAGSIIGGAVTNSAVAVSNGFFTVTLDFGVSVFTGQPRWLELGATTNGNGTFETLAPRQKLLPTPYAMYAGNSASVGSGAAVKSLNGLLDDVTLAAGANVTITPSGNTLTIASSGTGGGGIWNLNGANAYFNTGNVAIGTNSPLVGYRLDVNGAVVMRPGGSGGGSISFSTPNSETGMTISGASGRADLRFDGSTLKLVAGGAGSPPSAANGINISTNGNVGVGSSAPVGKLEVVGQDAIRIIGSQPFLTLYDSASGYASSRIQGVGGDLDFFTFSYISGQNPFSFLKLANNGNVGIGSINPVGKLEVVAQDALRLIGYQPFLTLYDSNTGYAGSRIQGVGGDLNFFTQNYLSGSDGNAYAKLFNSGNFSVKTLTIRGGADLAEPFEFSAKNIAKGSVLVIDDEQPGKLKLSTRAYDTRVAGIVSGANGVNPGISLHQDGVLDNGQDVALSGRVYVQADASQGAIKPGDLLTTSSTPGHAMKVSNHTRAQGAILGKAMSALPVGKGMVLVLVTLQ